MKKYLISTIVIVSAAAGVFCVWSGQDTPPQKAPVSSNTAATEEFPQRTPPLGWKEYLNPFHKFSLLYPEGHDVRGVTEEQGGATVVFEDITNATGFQIFIVPYTEQQTPDERFRLDVSSGVRTNVVEVSVDGAAGASFSSTDTELGELYEVWFVHNGYMYEVSTLAPLKEYIDTILQTWNFI